jgi:hypothetical protein
MRLVGLVGLVGLMRLIRLNEIDKIDEIDELGVEINLILPIYVFQSWFFNLVFQSYSPNLIPPILFPQSYSPNLGSPILFFQSWFSNLKTKNNEKNLLPI